MKTIFRFYTKYPKTHLKRAILLTLILLFSLQSSALNYYWIGGSGNWSELSHWATSSGGTTLHTEIPTALDDVYFDANSFTTSGESVTLDPLTILAHDISWAGALHNPTLAGPVTNLLKIYGSLEFISGMTMDFLGTISFEATATGKTIRMGSKTFNNNVEFNGIGGAWTLQDAFSGSGRLSLNNGILNSNNQQVDMLQFYSTTTTSRTLNMGNSVFNFSANDICWWVTATGMTIHSGTSVINSISDNQSLEFIGGDFTYYDLNFNGTGASSAATIIDNNSFHDVFFAADGSILQSNNIHNAFFSGDGNIAGSNLFNNLSFTAGHAYILGSGTTQTVNGILTANGTCGALIEIHAATPGNQATISHPAGSVNISFVILKDLLANGGGNFTAGNSIDLGNNSGWTISPATSKDLYWINNAGNWDDGNHWSLTSGGLPSGCSPTPLDDVFFDVNSFTASNQSVSINVLTAYCRDMNWTGAVNSPVLAGPDINQLKIYGSLRFISTMIMGFDGMVDFEATEIGKTITMSGRSFNNLVSFNGIGGGWTLQDAFATTSRMSLNNGTLSTSNNTVSAFEFYSNSGNTRSLLMGSSVFNLSGTSICWNASATAMILQCGTSTINATADNAGPNFLGGSLTYYNLNFTGTANSTTGNVIDNNHFHDVIFHSGGNIFQSNIFNDVTFYGDGQIQDNNTYHNLTFNSGHTYELTSGTTQTISGTLTATGNCGSLIALNSSTPGSQATISHPSGGMHISFVIIKDILATGVSTFIADNSIDLGNNTGVTIVTGNSKNLYWINNSGNWNDGNHWSLTSGGTASGCAPGPLDNVFFDINSFSLAGQTVLINVPVAYCRDMNWTGAINIPVLDGPNSNLLKIYGSLTFISAMNLAFLGAVNFEATGNGNTIQMNDKSFNNQVYFNGIDGTWTLQDPFTTNNRISLNNGTLNTNNQRVTALEFYSTSFTARTFNMGSSVVNLSGNSFCWSVTDGITLHAGTSVINLLSDNATISFVGGDLDYNDVRFLGINTIGVITGNNHFHDISFRSSGQLLQSNNIHNAIFNGNAEIQADNIFNNLTFTAGYTYKLWSGTTQTIIEHWNVQGSCNSYIVLQSSTSGSFATVTKAGGEVTGFNIHIKDIHCTGTANFIAYNSVDLGGNGGWNFSVLPTLLDPAVIVGPSVICAAMTTVTYHTAPVAGAISYQWTVPAGAVIISGQGDTLITVDFSTANSGNIKVQSYNGCNYSSHGSSIALVIGAQLTPTLTLNISPGNAVCEGTKVTCTAIAANTGNNIISYDFWLNGSSVQNSNVNSYDFTAVNGDKITCYISISAAVCLTTNTATSDTITMTVYPNPSVSFDNQQISISQGSSIQLSPTVSGNISTYTWTPSTGLSNPGIIIPVASPASTTTYTLTVVSTNNCKAANSISVTVVKENCTPVIPNVFTPNGDGINDVWIISQATCVSQLNVSVYNRYGSLLYHADNYKNDWRGTYKSKPCPDASYYYVIRAIYPNHKEQLFKGDITILR